MISKQQTIEEKDEQTVEEKMQTLKEKILNLGDIDSGCLHSLKKMSPYVILGQIIETLIELQEDSNNHFLDRRTKNLEKGIASVIRAQFIKKKPSLDQFAPAILNNMYKTIKDRGPCLMKSFIDTFYVVLDYYENQNLDTSCIFKWVEKADNPWVAHFLCEKYFEEAEKTKKIIEEIKGLYPNSRIPLSATNYIKIQKRERKEMFPAPKQTRDKNKKQTAQIIRYT